MSLQEGFFLQESIHQQPFFRLFSCHTPLQCLSRHTLYIVRRLLQQFRFPGQMNVRIPADLAAGIGQDMPAYLVPGIGIRIIAFIYSPLNPSFLQPGFDLFSSCLQQGGE